MSGNINDSFFEGYYKDIWRALIPDVLTQRETDFMISYFKLSEGAKVLDMMCGYGRHALTLARKGIEVVAVDNLADYTKEIGETAKKESLRVKTITGSILNFTSSEKFDLAICMGNSLQFFSENDVVKILSSVQKSMKPGGHILINSWSLAEIALNNFKEYISSRVGDMQFDVESVLKLDPQRIEVRSVITATAGDKEEKFSVDYIYSIPDMERMLKKSGFILKEVYSIPGKKIFTEGEPRAYIIAESKT